MPVTRITCPECGAGLKSAAGFTAGQEVDCPKCESTFAVEEPTEPAAAPARKPVRATASRVEDDDDDRPRTKKKKKRRDDDEDEDTGSYKNSPVRYVVLGVLVVTMVVLGVMLVLKKQREREEASARPPDDDDPPPRVVDPRPAPNPRGPQPKVAPVPPRGVNTGVTPKNPGGNTGGPFDLFGGPAVPANADKLTADLKQKLVGTWEGVAPSGAAYRVEYQADGKFKQTVGGGIASSGTWTTAGLIGTKGLKLNRGAARPVGVIFEDGELVHDTGTPGETVVLRKK